MSPNPGSLVSSFSVTSGSLGTGSCDIPALEGSSEEVTCVSIVSLVS